MTEPVRSKAQPCFGSGYPPKRESFGAFGICVECGREVRLTPAGRVIRRHLAALKGDESK